MKRSILICSVIVLTSCTTIQDVFFPVPHKCNVISCTDQLSDSKEVPLCYNHLLSVCQIMEFGNQSDKRKLVKTIFNQDWLTDEEFVECKERLEKVCKQYFNLKGE